jgi:hypothetical protein
MVPILKNPGSGSWTITCSCVSNQRGELHTPQADGSDILLHRKGKLTTAKLKSSCLSYNVVVSLSLGSILRKISSYEIDMSDSVVFYISSSLGYIMWI